MSFPLCYFGHCSETVLRFVASDYRSFQYIFVYFNYLKNMSFLKEYTK